MRVALFVPCYVDLLQPRIARATLAVLRRAGVDPEYPLEQTCCGQPAFNAGHHDEARAVAARFVSTFEPFDYIVAPSGSCVAMASRFAPELFSGPDADAARGVGSRTRELTDFLVNVLGVTDLGARHRARATYHDGCHSLRELGLGREARMLLGAVRNLELVEAPAPGECCGFGGTFSVGFPALSVEMGESKISALQSTRADLIISSDPSCLLHLGGLLSRRQSKVRLAHISEILASNVEE
jgi:L-lactate dehydrogenase complex protein LldE